MPIETELKLRLPLECITRLQRNPMLKSLTISRPLTRKIHSVYYDSSNFDLWRNGFAFRLRREGKHWMQTIKGGGGVIAGLHKQEEWEAPVLKAQPDLTKISDPFLLEILNTASLRERLHPLFITEFTRNTRILRLPRGGEAEFCLDRGKIIAGDASLPLCEIELELKSGSPAALFELALDLLRFIPFSLENASKAERGYALCSGRISAPFKAQPVKLDAEMNISEAFRTISGNCLSQLHNNEAGMLEGCDIEYLHQMRVALRRQRSAVSIFSRVFSKAALAPMAGELKWLAGQFGPARDWDVFTTEKLAKISTAFPAHAGIAALQEKCEQLRRHYNDKARKAVESRQYTEMMLKLGAWLYAGPWFAQPDALVPDSQAGIGAKDRTGTGAGMPVKEFAGILLAHRHRQIKKYGKKLAALDAPGLHALRIIAKKQRYAAEFFAELYSHSETKRYIQALSTLQDILGAINDAAIAERLLSEVRAVKDKSDEREAIGIVRGWSASLAMTQKLELNRAWKHFNRNDPFW